MPRPIPPAVLVTAIRKLLEFPFPQICRHSVACDLLEILEKYGAEVPEELARAVVQADDETALDALSRWDISHG